MICKGRHPCPVIVDNATFLFFICISTWNAENMLAQITDMDIATSRLPRQQNYNKCKV